jgi:thiazole synthase ThiGH ThiG subunit
MTPAISGHWEIIRRQRFVHRNAIAGEQADTVSVLRGCKTLIGGQFVIMRRQRSVHRNAIALGQAGCIPALISWKALIGGSGQGFVHRNTIAG